MPLRYCEAKSCSFPSVRGFTGRCMICCKFFCGSHFASAEHSCPNPHDDVNRYRYFDALIKARTSRLEDLLGQLDHKALAATASAARNGIPCSIPAFAPGAETAEIAKAQQGGQNFHLDIIFDDDVVWIARLKLANSPNVPPGEIQDYLFKSEVATMKFLATTEVLAPKIYDAKLRHDPTNKVGLSYMLLEKLPGKTLDWNGAPDEGRKKIAIQLAEIFIELQKFPFDQAGSIIDFEDGKATVGGYANRNFFTSPDGQSLGPFSSAKDAYEAIITHQLSLITNGEIGPLQVENYLLFRYLQEKLPEIVEKLGAHDRKFYLNHDDDKGDHLLVDDDWNITAILDWEWATLEPEPVAFASPCMLWPVNDFYAGKSKLAPEEIVLAAEYKKRGRTDMAEFIKSGRYWQRWQFMTVGMQEREEDLEGLIKGLVDVFGEGMEYVAWKKTMMEKLKDDDGLAILGRVTV
ncbi:hypothetical protein BJ508DRAFT_366588 [Ascobolus immersus RN42]|uniref:Aminoglycoside phosphotransferase domain-containing protein n=1 Tax=Ascobolus immersus RN42 TaxID=1160509 RepID=A0A3N4HMP6_ASCIM|nr:hypothetical protein BJ508DRAFT_366588 [Ascobolus immersus RN42]